MKKKNPNASQANDKIDESKLTFHNYLWYLIIFSILGLIVETIFCFITTGNLESRKQSSAASPMSNIWSRSSNNNIPFK